MRSAVLWSAVLLAVSVTGCDRAGSGSRDAKRVDLVVFAAASTSDVLEELRAPFEAAHPAHLVFNFGSSGDLARQILAASAADAFVSADPVEMDRVAAARRVVTDTRRDLVSNQLVVIEPVDPAAPASSRFHDPFTLDQLRDASIGRLSLANPESVPAGRYAKAWLDSKGAWPDLAARVVPAVDVRAALAAVESGAAPAGIVYRTDAARSNKVRVVHRVPLAEGPRIVYVAAAITERPHTNLARAWVDALAGEDARAAFDRAGFVPLESPAATGR